MHYNIIIYDIARIITAATRLAATVLFLSRRVYRRSRSCARHRMSSACSRISCATQFGSFGPIKYSKRARRRLTVSVSAATVCRRRRSRYRRFSRRHTDCCIIIMVLSRIRFCRFRSPVGDYPSNGSRFHYSSSSIILYYGNVLRVTNAPRHFKYIIIYLYLSERLVKI